MVTVVSLGILRTAGNQELLVKVVILAKVERQDSRVEAESLVKAAYLVIVVILDPAVIVARLDLLDPAEALENQA